MRNYWDILDIKPTTDLSTIKKAYAVKAKTVHPEENPDEFKELNEAYRLAIASAKKVAKIDDAIFVNNNFTIYRFFGKYDRKEEASTENQIIEKEVIQDKLSSIEDSFVGLLEANDSGLDFSSIKDIKKLGEQYKRFTEFINENIKLKSRIDDSEIINFFNHLDIETISKSSDYFNGFVGFAKSDYIKYLSKEVIHSISTKLYLLKRHNSTNKQQAQDIDNALAHISDIKKQKAMSSAANKHNRRKTNNTALVIAIIAAVFLISILIGGSRSEKPKYNKIPKPDLNIDYDYDRIKALEIEEGQYKCLFLSIFLENSFKSEKPYDESSSTTKMCLTEQQYLRTKEIYDNGNVEIIKLQNDFLRESLISKSILDHVIEIFTENKTYTHNNRVLLKYGIGYKDYERLTHVYEYDGVDALKNAIINHVNENIPSFDEVLNSYK